MLTTWLFKKKKKAEWHLINTLFMSTNYVVSASVTYLSNIYMQLAHQAWLFTWSHF